MKLIHDLLHRFFFLLHKIFFGPKFTRPYYCVPIFKSLKKDIKNIWEGNSFFLTRIISLILAIIQFILLYNVICGTFECLVGKWRKNKNTAYKVAYFTSDAYILLKLIFSYVFVLYNLSSNKWLSYLCIYLIIETLFYIIKQILIPGTNKPASNYRSLFYLLLNYFCISFFYASLYLASGEIEGVTCVLQAIYFSFVTSSTTGYGEMHPYPNSQYGQRLVVFQIITSVLFVVAFFPIFITNMTSKITDHRKTHHGSRKERQ